MRAVGARQQSEQSLEPLASPSAEQGSGQVFKGSQGISPKSFPGATTAAVPALPNCFH